MLIEYSLYESILIVSISITYFYIYYLNSIELILHMYIVSKYVLLYNISKLHNSDKLHLSYIHKICRNLLLSKIPENTNIKILLFLRDDAF